MNNLPTKPGPYWWREKEGNGWDVTIHLISSGGNLVMSHNHMPPERMGGQWRRIPEPDEGQEALGVFNHEGIFVMASFSDAKAMNECEYLNCEDITLQDGELYTHKPVTIFERDEE